MRRVTVLSARNLRSRLIFVNRFIAMYGIESAQKKKKKKKKKNGEVHDRLRKKKGSFIVNLFMDARSLPAQRRILFILV